MANTVTFDSITAFDSTLVTYDGEISAATTGGGGRAPGEPRTMGAGGQPGSGGASGSPRTGGSSGEPRTA